MEGEEVFRVIVPTTPRTTSDNFDIADEVFTSKSLRIVDGTVSELSVSVNTQTVNEGNSIDFTVSLLGSGDVDVFAGRELGFTWEVNCGEEVNTDGGLCG